MAPRPSTRTETTAARRTQVERSDATRAALQDAAIDLLVERGWAAVSAVEVSRRAGVTRGAFHHHYEHLPSLFADALGRLYVDLAHGSEPPSTMVGLLDAAWRAIGARRFKAVIEVYLAMGDDDTLRAEVGPVMTSFAVLVQPGSLAPELMRVQDHRDLYLTAREAMFGLALGRAMNGGRPLGHEERVLARLRTEAAAIDHPHDSR